MSIILERDDRRRWLIARVVGELTLEETLRFTGTVRASPATAVWPLLFDARGATTRMSETDVDSLVNGLAGLRATHRPPRAHAAIVADDDVLHARCLLYEMRAVEIGVRTIRVFRQLPDAEQWLTILSSTRHFGAGHS